MTTGFIRLGIVIVLITWIGAAILQWKHLDSDTWFIDRHISPHLRGEMSDFPMSNDWPAYAATPAFLALPVDERSRAAASFYETSVRPLESVYFTGRLEDWMIATATLDLSEAPVGYFTSGNIRTPYRQFDVPGIVIAPRMSYVLFGQNVILITAFLSIAVMIVLIIATLAVRWIHRGFAVK